MTITREQAMQAEAVLEVIEKNPEKHKQESWGEISHCGTTACVAGHIALLNGDATYVKNIDPLYTTDSWLELNIETTGRYDFQSYGMKKLGLDYKQSYVLFRKTNNEQAKEALKYLAKGELPDWDAIFSSDPVEAKYIKEYLNDRW